jgi:hypothetical protein
MNVSFRILLAALPLTAALGCGSAARDAQDQVAGDAQDQVAGDAQDQVAGDAQDQGSGSADDDVAVEDPPAAADPMPGADPSPAVVDLGAPVDGVSKRVKLQNGDTLTIAIDQDLVQLQGTDSQIGELRDAAGSRLCSYDIGPYGALVSKTLGAREESVNQVFYYWPRVIGGEGDEGAWEATFYERGPTAFYCRLTLSAAEFLGLMRTYTSSTAPIGGS